MLLKDNFFEKKSNFGRANLLWIAFFAGLLLLGSAGAVLGRVLDQQLAESGAAPVKTEEAVPLPQSQLSGLTSLPSVPGSFELPGTTWIPQTYNNCGPAATAMTLQYFGIQVSQAETKAALRKSADDKNVTLAEIKDYLKDQHGLEAKIFFGGSVERAKLLISQGFYLVVEDWLHPDEDIGHVMILRGYDDSAHAFIGDDSYIGVGVKYDYDTFVRHQWKAFNYEYMPVYRPDKENLLKFLVGDDWDEKTMYTHALQLTEAQAQGDPRDVYAWFNLGSSAYGLGDYQKAKSAYQQAKSLGWPKRMLWYQIQPIQALNKLGEYGAALELANEALAGNQSFAEVQAEKEIALRGLGNPPLTWCYKFCTMEQW